ncbi:MAG: 4-hydroxybenzoate octaprenyltransferase [Actinobacteria bacterium]|nr:4-hydroxybenzoate octaprenyltransferase [Actinomycetota bacterium]MBM2828523.1 4-hydroxybenzoate octaprenyltransferase [Actinomycetota bacterium]
MLGRAGVYLEMIKVAHSVFALPFALMGAFLAAGGLPSGKTVFYIVLAMVGGRSAAMGFNRVTDAEIDAMNPRTRNRAIPAGQVSKAMAGIMIFLSVLLLMLSAAKLNPLCLKLSPVLLLLLFSYSYTKRFTWASHLVLGLCLGAAPLAAWIAVTGSFDPRVLVISFAVMFWVAGFDVLYALQDIEFDRRERLHSIPRFLGVGRSLWVARAFHLAMAGLLLLGYHVFRLGGWYLAGVGLCAAVLVYEHSILKENDLSRLNVAFFNLNGIVSIALCLFTYLDLAL